MNHTRRKPKKRARDEEPKYKLREFRLEDIGTDQPDKDLLVNYANFLRSGRSAWAKWLSHAIAYVPQVRPRSLLVREKQGLLFLI